MSEITRCKYKKSQLLEVIYQLNFPTILSIESKEISDYQDAIRKEFPKYKKHEVEEREFNFTISDLNLEQEITKPKSKIIHVFISEDAKWKVTLSSDYISVSTLEYQCFSDFKEHMKTSIEKFIELYKPAYFNRIAVRYIDAFSKKELGLESSDWKDLIQPHLLGLLGCNQCKKENIESNIIKSQLKFTDYKIRLQAGLGRIHSEEGVEIDFVEDCDCYIDKRVEISSIEEQYAFLHERAGEFFRNSITKKLHDAMEPER